MPDPLVAAFTEALTAPDGPIPAGFAEDYAVELAAIARRVIGAEVNGMRSDLADARASCDGAMADLAALVEVAAGAVSDETAHDPGVMRLMRYLAANHQRSPSN